jgi:3-dehydroquinate synthase
MATLVQAGFEPVLVTVPAGEPSKCLATAQDCYERLAAHRLERDSFVVALGGGVVGDLAGFLAATYLRGLALVQVPTSLLAQVDSSVGGKVGLNLKAAKNLVGAFHQPRLVLCDLETLDTLPDREYRSGLSEVIKYGVVYDARLFAILEKQMEPLRRRDDDLLGKVVARCCTIKAEVVVQDEREGGLRAILNFGHTVGHALEATCGYGRFLHGEAIAIGQVAAAALSQSLMGLPADATQRIVNLILRAGLPTTLALSRSQQDRVIQAMALDKKAAGGQVRFVLAEKIGKVVYGIPVPTDRVRAALAIRPATKSGPGGYPTNVPAK